MKIVDNVQILITFLCSVQCLVLTQLNESQTLPANHSNVYNISKNWLKFHVTRSGAVGTLSLVPSAEFSYNAINSPSIQHHDIPYFNVSYLHMNENTTTRTFGDPAITETSSGGSLQPSPSITKMAPENMNSRENTKSSHNTFTRQVLPSEKNSKLSFVHVTASYAESTLPSTSSNQNASIHSNSKKLLEFGNPMPTPPKADPEDYPPVYYGDLPAFINDHSSVNVPMTHSEVKTTTKSPIYSKDEEFTDDKDTESFSNKDKIPTYEKEKNVKPEQPECQPERSCKGRCGFERQFSNIENYDYQWSCFCDPECDKIYEDCCADFDQLCNANLMHEHVVESELNDRWNCTAVFGDYWPIWVIGQCAPGWKNDDVLRRCTEKNTSIISELIPVIDQHNNTFLNRYCAICNNVTEFSQWKFEAFCDIIPPTGYTEVQWSTFLDFFCPQNSFNLTQTWGKRYCFDVMSDCSYWAEEKEVEACETGPTGLITEPTSSLHYRNWDCILCNSMDDGILPVTACGPSPLTIAPPHIIKGGTLSFSSIFRASSFVPLSSARAQSRCPKGQFYEPTSQQCKIFLNYDDLEFGGVLRRYAVILDYKEHSDSCNISLSTESDDAALMTRFTDVFQKLLRISLLERDSKFMDLKVKPFGDMTVRAMFELLENSQENELVESSIGHDLKLKNLIFHSQLRNFSGGLCRYSMNGSIVHKMSCVENNTFSLHEVQISGNESAFIKKTGRIYSYREYLVFKDEKRWASCRDYWPGDCSLYAELTNESDWSIAENGSVYTDMTEENSWLNYGEYTIVDGILRLCLSKFAVQFNATIWINQTISKPMLTTIHDVILSYATTICLSISVLCLAVLLLVYSLFRSLRNLPGKNLMLFSGTLACSQLLWLLQPRITSFYPMLCVGIAFALQYFFLASFSCSTSIALHSLTTFLNIAKGKLTRSSSEQAFLHYVLYSLGFPLLLFLICWLLYYHDLFIIIQQQQICWFKHDWSIYIAFYIPGLTILLLNLILLLKTMLLIRECTKERQNLAKENGTPTKAQVGIYLRMSTIMGATWLFGVFVVVFPDIVVFEYLFVFINGLQGLYVALAFLFTDNVKKLILRRKRRGTKTFEW